MQIIRTSDLRMLIADMGKHIKAINDVYVPEHIDEETGKTIHEHIPSYSTVYYLADNVEDNEVESLFVEEEIE